MWIEISGLFWDLITYDDLQWWMEFIYPFMPNILIFSSEFVFLLLFLINFSSFVGNSFNLQEGKIRKNWKMKQKRWGDLLTTFWLKTREINCFKWIFPHFLKSRPSGYFSLECLGCFWFIALIVLILRSRIAWISYSLMILWEVIAESECSLFL